MPRSRKFKETATVLYSLEIVGAVVYPFDLAKWLQGFRGMRNVCSVSGGWCLKALEHEYIDRRMLMEVF